MKNQTYFTLENPRGSMRQFKKADNYLEQRVKYDTGYFDGNARSIPAIVINGATENDLWYVVNLRDAVSNVFLQAIAVLGALDADQAIYVALQTFGDEYNHPTNDSVTVSDASYFALKRFLDIKQPFYGEITQAALNECQAQVLKQPATWSDDNITSHNGSMAALMHDMVQSDVNGELLDPVSKYDAVDMFIGDDGVIGTYDALITSYQRLDLLQERLATAMGKAAKGDDITLTGVTRSKPFKRNGVVNVAVIYELSDGQTISVIFHNPDSTPTKLSAQDTLTSWKWLLNKRDVSIVLQPKNGENVQLNQLAIRMLKLAHQNSARFKRTIAKRLENEKTLADMLVNQAELEKTEVALDAEIIDLQKQIDEKTKAVDLDLSGDKVEPVAVEIPDEPVVEPAVAAPVEAPAPVEPTPIVEPVVEEVVEPKTEPVPQLRQGSINIKVMTEVQPDWLPEEVALRKAQDEQEMMKAVNKAIRGDDLEKKIKALMALKYDLSREKAIQVAMTVDYSGRQGFPTYMLTNNNALIKRLQAKADFARKSVDAENSGMVDDVEVAGVSIEFDRDDDRLRLVFDGKPETEVVSALKSNGFKWSPRNSAWQRQLTENAIKGGNTVLKLHAELTGQEFTPISLSGTAPKPQQEVTMPEIEPMVLPAIEPEPVIEPVTGDEMAVTDPIVDADTEYLQSIINGTADLATAGDDLERIGENLNPELEDLFEQAAEAYAQYAIAQEAATI